MRKLKTIGLMAMALVLAFSFWACEPVKEPELVGIEVSEQPTKVAYFEGEEFDPTGMKVVAVYDDESTEEITDYEISPEGALTADVTKITITYQGKTATVDITVTPITLTGISVETGPTKNFYFAGETFNPAGMVVLAHFNDSSTETVTNYTFSPSGALTVDDDKVTISYQGKTATVDITVVSVVSIAVTTQPTKTTYYEGETFNPAGMVVKATLNNSDQIEITNYTFSPSGALSTEDTQITITAHGKSTTVNITVNPPQPQGTPIGSVEEFAAINNDLNGNYYLTNDIDFGGTTINRIGHFDNMPFNGVFDGRGFALKNFVVGGGPGTPTEWGRALFGRLGTNGVIKNLAIIGGSTTGNCVGLLVGAPLGTIENVYLEGTVTNNENAEYGRGGTIYGRMEWSLGEPVLRNIVVNVTTQGAGAYTLGGRFNPATVVENVFVVTDNLVNPAEKMATTNKQGNPVEAVAGVTTFAMANISTVDFSVLPSAYWNIAEGQLPALKHLEPGLESLTITTAPDKTDYYEGETFDPAGMVVEVAWEDGSTEAVTAYTITPSGALTGDVTQVTVSYKGFSATVDVNVIALESLEITAQPKKVEYAETQTFVTTGMTVKANYADETSKTITDYTYNTEPLKPTDTAMVISYGSKQVSIPITVYAKIAISSAEDFNQVYDNLKGYYYLTQDIDFAGAALQRIGHYELPGFEGIFDGRGYALKNFTVASGGIPSAAGKDPGDYGKTLFAYLDTTGIIRNLAIIGATITGRGVGLLVGNNYGLIENCYLEGTISNIDWNQSPWGVGGPIFGRNQGNGIIRNVVTKATAGGGGTMTFGGVHRPTATLTNCFAVTNGLTHGDPMTQWVRTAENTSITVPGNYAFKMENIEQVDFSTLPSEYWDIVPGQLPTLKHLD